MFSFPWESVCLRKCWCSLLLTQWERGEKLELIERLILFCTLYETECQKHSLGFTPTKQNRSKVLRGTHASDSKQTPVLGKGLETDSQWVEPERQSSDVIAHAVAEHGRLCLEQVVVLLP